MNLSTPLRSVAVLTASATVVAITGCTHPNIKVSPAYDPPASPMRPIAEDSPTAIAIQVTDQRRFKGEFRDDGSEVIASGDKGKVILETPIVGYFEKNLADAFTAAGFDVRADADITLNVTLRELRFEALAFTHWGLPSDRASTLDMAGLILPGPPRDTRALTVADVDLNKDGQELGLSYYIEGYAWDKNTGKEPAVVAQVISESWSDTINRIVANTAPGLPIVAKRPMTPEEREANQAALATQRAELEAAVAQLQEREAQLAADRAELAQIRSELENERNALAKQSQDNRQQTEALNEKIAALEAQITQAKADAKAQQANAADTSTEAAAALAAKLASLEVAQAEVVAERLVLATAFEQMQAKKASLEAQTHNLQGQLAELDTQRQLFANRSLALTRQEQAVEQRRGELETWNLALADWKTRLAQAESEVAEREAAFREREAEIARSEAAVQAKQDELEKLAIERAALTEKTAPPALPDPKNKKPIIYVSQPEALTPTTKRQVLVTGHVFDDVEVVRTNFYVNGKPIDPSEQKGVAMSTVTILSSPTDGVRGVAGTGMRSPGDSKGFVEFALTVPLADGNNRVRVEAWDNDGESASAEFDVQRKTDKGLIHMVSIGINDYNTASNGVPPLRFAVADAMAVADAFDRNMGITGQNIQLFNEDATRSNIIQALRKTLPGNVSKQDTVIVFFSGHGAPETVAGGLSGSDHEENLVRYLLPVEAEADNLIGSAIPMQDIARYFRLLPCERLIFLADTCYSGGIADGGRTVAVNGEAFKGVGLSTVQIVNRASGQGRVIITASKDTEIAHEKQELGHGVFTYHLVEGLNGAADADHNRQVTVRELYDYVATAVAKTTEGSQHPQINDDELRGDLTVSRLE